MKFSALALFALFLSGMAFAQTPNSGPTVSTVCGTGPLASVMLDNPAYPVKSFFEGLDVFLTANPTAKQIKLSNYANERLCETQVAASNGEVALEAQGVNNFKATYAAASGVQSTSAVLTTGPAADYLLNYTPSQVAVLNTLYASAPPSLQPTIGVAITDAVSRGTVLANVRGNVVTTSFGGVVSSTSPNGATPLTLPVPAALAGQLATQTQALTAVPVMSGNPGLNGAV